MATTVVVKETMPKKKGLFWRRKNQPVETSATLSSTKCTTPSMAQNAAHSPSKTPSKSPSKRVFRKKVLTSRHKPAPLPHDFEKIPLDDSNNLGMHSTNDFISNIQVLNQPHKKNDGSIQTHNNNNNFQTPEKRNGIHSYPQYSTERHHRPSVTMTPQTEASATPSPNRWQTQKEEEQIQSILRLHQLAEQYNHENSTNSSQTQRLQPQSHHRDDHPPHAPTSSDTSKLLQTVLGVSTACAPPPTRQAIRRYASNPTPPSKVVSMTMIKDGSMKFAEVVKESVLKIVQCAGDLPLDEDGTTARAFCSGENPEFFFDDEEDSMVDQKKYPRNERWKQQDVMTSKYNPTMDKNFTYHDDDEERYNEKDIGILDTNGMMNENVKKGTAVKEESNISISMGKMQVSNRGVASKSGMESHHNYTSFVPITSKGRETMLDLANADPLASNIPFDERSLDGEKMKEPMFENDRHARAIALGLDDASMLTDEGGEI